MLAACVHKGYPVSEYLSPESPCQKDILRELAAMCGIVPGRIHLGVDGCSAPAHALPRRNMALGFARLANPGGLEGGQRRACEAIFAAVNKRPEMISGTGGSCSDLIRESRGKLIGKVGAEGVYCVGIKGRGLGFAVKIESGSMAVLPPVVLRMLDTLRVLDPEELTAVERYRRMEVRNDNDRLVGHEEAAYQAGVSRLRVSRCAARRGRLE